MRRRRFTAIAVAALATFVVAEPACHAALATKLGKKRFTAKLSSNPAIRRQQLIVDPEGILGGSASVRYDPTVVRLVDVIDPAAYDVTGGYVDVIPSSGGFGSGLLPLDAFLDRPSIGGRAGVVPAVPTVPAEPAVPPLFFERGFVQVFFNRRAESAVTSLAAAAAASDAPSVIENLPGYTTVAEDGETGVADTHALVFEYLPGVPDEFRASYSVFATPPRAGTVSDFIVPADDPEHPIPYTDLEGATVIGTLSTTVIVDPGGGRPHPVPLPSAVAAGGLLMAAGAGAAAVRRRRRAVAGRL
ncbi:MAG: hypothetical protein JWO31_2721 [Phycisphaerales bacterium]|nr:hypothetical protein [Phycisphaerales bacterium]